MSLSCRGCRLARWFSSVSHSQQGGCSLPFARPMALGAELQLLSAVGFNTKNTAPRLYTGGPGVTTSSSGPFSALQTGKRRHRRHRVPNWTAWAHPGKPWQSSSPSTPRGPGIAGSLLAVPGQAGGVRPGHGSSQQPGTAGCPQQGSPLRENVSLQSTYCCRARASLAHFYCSALFGE